MKNDERIVYYSDSRRNESKELEERVSYLINKLTKFQQKAAKAKTAGCDERVNITTFQIREFESQLQMITQNVENIERYSAILEVLQ